MNRVMDAGELRRIPILADVSDAAIERILASCAELEAAPGQVLALPDDPGSGMFLVLDGSITVELPHARRELGPGDVFGEIALLVEGTGRIARVRADDAARLVAIPRDEALALLESEPPLALALLRELARRVADLAT
jgi:CRP/FNR family transcriptional regulator, cyclic AMP receptor protein